MSNLSFKASLRSLWKLLNSLVNRSPRQAVPDHLQRFLQLDDCLRFEWRLWWADNFQRCPQPWYITRGLGSVNLESTGFWQDNLDIWFGSSDVHVTNFESTNKEPRHAPSVASALWHRSILKCVLKKLSKLTTKLLSVYEVYAACLLWRDKSTVIIVILKERKGFRSRVLVQIFLNALNSFGGNAAMLTISRFFWLVNYVYTSMYVYVVYISV